MNREPTRFDPATGAELDEAARVMPDQEDRLMVDQQLLAQLLPDQADFIKSLDLSTEAGVDA